MTGATRDWRRMAEAGIAVLMLAISAAVWWSSFSLPPAMLEPIGPAAFPRAVASILALLAAMVLAGTQRTRARPLADAPEMGRRRPGLALFTLVLSVAYLGAMDTGVLGFRDATVVYLIVLGAAMVRLDRRRLVPVVAIALVVGVGAHWIFTRLFFIDLP